MKIGVLSDTHDRNITLQRALSLFRAHNVAFLIHCGDWTSVGTLQKISTFCQEFGGEVVGVFGNRDDYMTLAEAGRIMSNVSTPADDGALHLVVDDRKLSIYHGHHKPTLQKLISGGNYDALFTGHTHKPLIEHPASGLIINPGSTAFSIPRRKQPRSVAIYETLDNSATLYYFE